MIEIQLRVHTVSESNAHEHWRQRQRRAKEQRLHAFAMVRSKGKKVPPLPITVRLVRVSPGELDDDNLRGALKHVRDGIADAYGVKDNDERVTFAYAQESGPHAVRVGIEGRT